MTTDATTTEATTTAEAVEPARAETDWKAEARKWEQRAKGNAEAAERLAELEGAKTAEQEAREAAEFAAQEARTEALRFRVAAEHGVTASDAALFLTGQDADTITAQAKRLAELVEAGARRGGRAPLEGASPSSSAGADERSFITGLFGAN